MFCTNCGNPVEENAKFCSKCGALMQVASPAPEAPVYEAPAAPAPEAPVYEAPAAPAPEAPVYEAPAAPAPEAPAYEVPVAPVYVTPAPVEEGSKLGRIFSLISMLCGIVSIVLFWFPVPFMMLTPSMAAVALGIVGMIKKGAKGKCIAGIILGAIAFFLILIFGIAWSITMETNYHF